jgi:hypothetical protein
MVFVRKFLNSLAMAFVGQREYYSLTSVLVKSLRYITGWSVKDQSYRLMHVMFSAYLKFDLDQFNIF